MRFVADACAGTDIPKLPLLGSLGCCFVKSRYGEANKYQKEGTCLVRLRSIAQVLMQYEFEARKHDLTNQIMQLEATMNQSRDYRTIGAGQRMGSHTEILENGM